MTLFKTLIDHLSRQTLLLAFFTLSYRDYATDLLARLESFAKDLAKDPNVANDAIDDDDNHLLTRNELFQPQ